MNGVLRKIVEERERQWNEQTSGKVLSADLVVPEEQLFTESLDRLRDLDLRMLDEMKEVWALRAQGAAYELSWHNQRRFSSGRESLEPLMPPST
jgi:hypothetical protein